MRKHLRYLSYVCLHKWFVLVEACRLGIPWQGVTHDLSKFRPSEWFPYVEFFYGPKKPKLMETHGEARNITLSTGYFHERAEGQFDMAWLLHQKRNPHHWQWWLLPEDNGGTKVMEMPLKYRKEMLADWKGAGKAQGKPDTANWFLKNGLKMLLHPETRAWLEQALRVKDEIDIGAAGYDRRDTASGTVFHEDYERKLAGEKGA